MRRYAALTQQGTCMLQELSSRLGPPSGRTAPRHDDAALPFRIVSISDLT